MKPTMSYIVPSVSVQAPLKMGSIGKPATDQLSELLRAERALEEQRMDIRRVKDRSSNQGPNGRGPLPPLGLRTYPNRQGVTVQAEEEEMDLSTEQ